MSEKPENSLKQEIMRRNRINKIKKGIIYIAAIWMAASVFLSVTLLVRVIHLENTLKEVRANIPTVEQVKNTENQNLPGLNTDGSAGRDTIDIGEPIQQKEIQEEQTNSNEKRKVYLTFDDGPSVNTETILDILDEYQVKATFFVIGKTDEVSQEMYKEIVARGHTLGMHSYTHKYSVIYNSMEAFQQDYRQIHDYLQELTGVDCKYYRFPGGSSNQVSNRDMSEFISYLNSEGVTYYDWNVSSGDATSQAYTADELVGNVIGDVTKYKSSVVLMHDSISKPATVEALSSLIEQLQGMGAEILPIDENTVPIQHVKIDTQEGP